MIKYQDKRPPSNFLVSITTLLEIPGVTLLRTGQSPILQPRLVLLRRDPVNREDRKLNTGRDPNFVKRTLASCRREGRRERTRSPSSTNTPNETLSPYTHYGG